MKPPEPAVNVAPAFADDQETMFMVAENMDAGYMVGTAMAVDEGDTLTYTTDSMYFEVDGDGNITTTMMLDYEAMMSHTVMITATDDDADDPQSDSITVTIMVENGRPGCDMVHTGYGNGLGNDCEALLDSKDALDI